MSGTSAPPPEGPGDQQPPFGGQQPSYPSPPSGQPGYGQPAYGQPGYYGQPADGTPAYGQVPSAGVPASMGTRLLARIIDSLIVVIPFAIIYTILLVSLVNTNEVDPETGEVSGGGGIIATIT
jgi:hypothetical protein